MYQSTEVIPELYDKDVLILPPKKVFELQMGGKRLYYEWRESATGEMLPKFYIGCTSFLQAVLPTSPFLIEWKVKLGEAEAARVLEERSKYGSMMHTQYSHLMINREFDLNEVEGIVASYIATNKLREDLLDEWTQELSKDILAFAQWMKDYDAQPILIEGAMTSDMYGVAGRVDFFGYITIEEKGFFGDTYKSGDRKGEPKESKMDKRVLAVVDFKSGKGGNFYLSHELQLMIYQQLVAENFPDQLIKIGMPVSIWNFSPSDWRTAPSYKFVCHDGKHNWDELEALFDYYHLTNNFSGQRFLDISGKISLDRYESINECYKSLSLSDIVTPKTEREEPVKPQNVDALFLDL